MGTNDQTWDPDPDLLCPSCRASTHVRSDTGRCERCTAVMPEQLEAWKQWRAECALRQLRRDESIRPGRCVVCKQPWHANSQDDHDKRCPARPIACDCGRRFWDEGDRDTHRRYNACGKREFYRLKAADLESTRIH